MCSPLASIELKGDTKARFALERVFDFVLDDYREAIYVFDAAAAEWWRMMAKPKTSRSHTMIHRLGL